MDVAMWMSIGSVVLGSPGRRLRLPISEVGKKRYSASPESFYFFQFTLSFMIM